MRREKKKEDGEDRREMEIIDTGETVPLVFKTIIFYVMYPF